MPSRIQSPDPLLGATPALRPQSQPLAVQPGAAPAPRSSPLMQLASAFEGVNGELRDMLRDAAAKEEQDAQALGEIEAGKLAAQGRMAEIEKVLKQKVDAGELSSVRLPAAQRGAAVRIGHEHAEVGLQTYLLSKRPDILKGATTVEEVVSKGVAQFGAAISPNAYYEKLAFEKSAQDVVSRFRTQVAQDQVTEAEKVQREQRSNEGSELLFQLSTAPVETKDTARQFVKTYLDAIHSEMPKSKVTEFFSGEVLAPAVDRLIQEKNFTAANQLLEEMKSLDLTGKGGLYGKTSEGGKTIQALSEKVDREETRNTASDYRRMSQEMELAGLIGRKKAAEDLAALENQNNGTLPDDARQRIQNEARAALSPSAYEAYKASINGAYENQERWRQDPSEGARILSGADTLDPKELEARAAELEVAHATHSISPSVYLQATEVIKRNRALAGIVEDRDVTHFTNSVFAVKSPSGYGVGVAFTDAPTADAWGSFNERLQTDIRTRTGDYFVQQFREEIRMRSKGRPEEAAAIQTQAYDAASTRAMEYAKSLITQSKRDSMKEEADRRAAQQAVLLSRAKVYNGRFGIQPDLTLPSGKKYNLPAGSTLTADQFIDLQQQPGPHPEADAVNVYIPARSIGDYFSPGMEGTSRVVDLPALAKEMVDGTGDRAVKAKNMYAYVKGLIGFTSKEVIAGKTKHGVEFDASKVDPELVPLFESEAELNKHWNNGEPDQTFLELGDRVDTKKGTPREMTTHDFYLAQLAVLRSRK